MLNNIKSQYNFPSVIFLSSLIYSYHQFRYNLFLPDTSRIVQTLCIIEDVRMFNIWSTNRCVVLPYQPVYLCFLSSCIFWRGQNFCFMGSVITMAYLKSCFIQQNWKHNIPSASGRKYDLGKMYYFKTYFETLRSFQWQYPSVFILNVHVELIFTSLLQIIWWLWKLDITFRLSRMHIAFSRL